MPSVLTTSLYALCWTSVTASRLLHAPTRSTKLFRKIRVTFQYQRPNMSTLCKVLVVAALATRGLADDIDLGSRAFVLVQKSIKSPESIKHEEGELKNVLVKSRNASVVVTVNNVGEEAARDVQVVDSFEEDLFLIDGATSANFKTLGAGETRSFEFTIVPKWFTEDLRNVSQYYTHRPASVVYSYGEGDDLVERVSESSTEQIVPIFSNEDYQARTAMFVKEWITFFVLAAIPVFGPFFHYNANHKKMQDGQRR